MEIENFKVIELPQVLKKETLIEKAWKLIDDAEANCLRLDNAGIKCSHDLLSLTKDIEKMNLVLAETNISREYILALIGFTCHKFKSIALKKLDYAHLEHIKILESIGIINTKELLYAGKTKEERLKLSQETKIPIENLENLLTTADLLRLYAIGPMKLRLFMANGIKSLKNLGEQEPDVFRLKLEKNIKETGIVKAVPKPKEMRSDVTWARLYPEIVIF